MATTTTTTAADLIEEVVSSIVQETLIQRSIMIPSVMDMSSMVRQGMDLLKIPRFTALAVQDVTEGTEVTPAAPTIATDNLPLNKNKAITWAISDLGSLQSKVDMAAQIVKDAARQHAKQVDDDIIAEMEGNVSASAPDHIIAFAAGGVLSDQDCRNARELLNLQNVDMDDRYLLIGPAAEKELLGVAGFVEADKYGSADAVQNGELGRLYGFRVLMSTSSSLTSGDALFYHRSTCAYASQQAPKFESDRNILTLQDEFALSQVYGVKSLDSGKRSVLVNTTGA